MTPRTKKTAAALSGALVLASGAYALGSQTGDGQRSRARTPTPPARPRLRLRLRPRSRTPGFRGGPRQDLADAAEAARRLARTSSSPRSRTCATTASGKIDDLRDAFAKALATAARHPPRPRSRPRSTSAHGDRTGASSSRDGRRGDMRDALRQAARGQARHRPRPRSARRSTPSTRPARPARPTSSALATKLGVTEAKLRDALQSLRPGPGPRPVRPRQARLRPPRPA